MNEFLEIIQRNKFIYAIIISVIATIFVMNVSLDFAEKIRQDWMIGIIALSVFIIFFSYIYLL